MGNSVMSRRNHYETLGLTPAASDDEIRQAFARKMSECRWDPTGASAQICIAYETLSNRFKRADYDRAHGLEPKPHSPLSTMTVTQQHWAPFIASVATNAFGQAARDALATPHVTAQHDLDVLAAPESRVRIAASLRETTRPGTRGASSNRRPRPQERQRPLESLELQLFEMPPSLLADEASPGDCEDRQLDWKRPALAVGGFVLAAGLIGAFAGLSLKDDEGSTLIEPPAVLAAPAPRQKPAAAASLTQPLAAETDVKARRPVRPFNSGRRTASIRWRRHSPIWARHRAIEGRTAGNEPVDVQPNADQSVTKAPIAQPVATDLPHPTG